MSPHHNEEHITWEISSDYQLSIASGIKRISLIEVWIVRCNNHLFFPCYQFKKHLS